MSAATFLQENCACAPSTRQRHRHARTLTLAPSAALPPSHLSCALALRLSLVRPACNKSLNSWPPSETWRRSRQILGERLGSACVYYRCTEMITLRHTVPLPLLARSATPFFAAGIRGFETIGDRALAGAAPFSTCARLLPFAFRPAPFCPLLLLLCILLLLLANLPRNIYTLRVRLGPVSGAYAT